MRTWTRRRLLLSTAAGTAGLAVTAPAYAAGRDRREGDDILNALRALPGLRLIEERQDAEPGYRHFVLGLRQPVDHTDPAAGTFEQRLTLLHAAADRPTVLFSTGYDAVLAPRRTEPQYCWAATNSRSNTATSAPHAQRAPATPTSPSGRPPTTITASSVSSAGSTPARGSPPAAARAA